MIDKTKVKIDLGEIIESKAMREVGIGQMIGKLGVTIEGMTKVSVVVDQDLVLELIQTGIGTGVLNVKNMTISQGIVQQHRQTER